MFVELPKETIGIDIINAFSEAVRTSKIEADYWGEWRPTVYTPYRRSDQFTYNPSEHLYLPAYQGVMAKHFYNKEVYEKVGFLGRKKNYIGRKFVEDESRGITLLPIDVVGSHKVVNIEAKYNAGYDITKDIPKSERRVFASGPGDKKFDEIRPHFELITARFIENLMKEPVKTS